MLRRSARLSAARTNHAAGMEQAHRRYAGRRLGLPMQTAHLTWRVSRNVLDCPQSIRVFNADRLVLYGWFCVEPFSALAVAAFD
jgi:hypothetical protein